jgi:hypothetical protein
MHCAVAKRRQSPRRSRCDAVIIVEEPDWAGAARHQLPDDEFKAAVRRIDGKQRMPGAVLTFLAYIEKGNFALAAEPLPQRRDIDRPWFRLRTHPCLPKRALVRGFDR